MLSTALSLINTRGMAPIRAAHGLPRGGAGGSCVPLVELCANSWLLEPPRPLGPPQVRGGAEGVCEGGWEGSLPLAACATTAVHP